MQFHTTRSSWCLCLYLYLSAAHTNTYAYTYTTRAHVLGCNLTVRLPPVSTECVLYTLTHKLIHFVCSFVRSLLLVAYISLVFFALQLRIAKLPVKILIKAFLLELT